jgi:hypothetical protein
MFKTERHRGMAEPNARLPSGLGFALKGKAGVLVAAFMGCILSGVLA